MIMFACIILTTLIISFLTYHVVVVHKKRDATVDDVFEKHKAELARQDTSVKSTSTTLREWQTWTQNSVKALASANATTNARLDQSHAALKQADAALASANAATNARLDQSHAALKQADVALAKADVALKNELTRNYLLKSVYQTGSLGTIKHQTNNLLISPRGEIELGAGATKGQHNGKIAYQKWSGGLDIVGAGSTVAARQVTIWNEGGATFKGPVTVAGKVCIGSTCVDEGKLKSMLAKA